MKKYMKYELSTLSSIRKYFITEYNSSTHFLNSVALLLDDLDVNEMLSCLENDELVSLHGDLTFFYKRGDLVEIYSIIDLPGEELGEDHNNPPGAILLKESLVVAIREFQKMCNENKPVIYFIQKSDNQLCVGSKLLFEHPYKKKNLKKEIALFFEGKGGNLLKTFFPDDWSEERVEKTIEDSIDSVVITEKIGKNGTKYGAIMTLPGGIVLRMILNCVGESVSVVRAFPCPEWIKNG